ncbi:hypothetical protein EJV47_27380 [Hymenobacter gummosus]|uniref:Lipoprotein n=1 Tax=Hymenobacter gummosus TaxID=1776032 RepID=A0A431TUC7_9BACT|nr:hypothetical protein [Hymenobacter gummosus]RTQ44717.1 hypothetical protein EJV47_27380 [Hymenobacter gummosus]
MKWILFCLSFLLMLAGCRDKPTAEAQDAFLANTRPDSVVLENGLGTVYLRVPRTYDTLFAWTSYSDCDGCDDIRYRFQSRKLPVYRESGFVHRFPIDSVNQLTIIHNTFFKTGIQSTKPHTTRLHDSLLNRWHQEVTKEKAAKKTDLLFGSFDTLEHINGRDFGIKAFWRFDSLRLLHINDFEASTDKLRFVYTLRTRQNDSTARHFQRDALRLLRTIRIRPGR